MPDDILTAWRALGRRGAQARADWSKRLSGHDEKIEFERRMAGELPTDFSLQNYISALLADPKKVATRKASGNGARRNQRSIA